MNQHDLPPLPFPECVVLWIFPSGVGVPHPHLPDTRYTKRRLTGLDNEETGPPFAPYWHMIPFPGVTEECRARFSHRLLKWLERVRSATPAELLP